MLQKLSIRNYALIDSLDIEFDKGLNIITGETGAGKSIILGALSLILGQRAESKFFFNQDKKCIIEGTFILQDEKLKSFFESHEVDFLTETILRREIAIDGKSRAFINDTPVTLAVIKQIGEQLIAIHSQHATLELNSADFQLLIVDSLASHNELLRKYRLNFKQWKDNLKKLDDLVDQAEQARSKQDYEQFLFNELEQANLQANEQEDLEQELEKLIHAESIKKNLHNAYTLMSEYEPSALSILKESLSLIQQAEKFDPAINELSERIKSSMIELRDIASDLSSVEGKTTLSADRIDFIQQRLDLIYSLQRKHRVANNSDLLDLQRKLEENLNQLFSADEQIAKLREEISFLLQQLLAQANDISKNRQKSTAVVTEAITKTLSQVEMPNAKLSFEHKFLDEPNKDGIDQISLLFSANAGQALAPVAKVASGGELSRLMLAIKALLAKHTSLPTLIFDEIDTGISGETALKVGEVLANLGTNMQILSITHLPQIAAKGNSHYFVYKNEVNKRTTTGIRKLNREERMITIAEMLSGKNPGASALQNAKELMG